MKQTDCKKKVTLKKIKTEKKRKRKGQSKRGKENFERKSGIGNGGGRYCVKNVKYQYQYNINMTLKDRQTD